MTTGKAKKEALGDLARTTPQGRTCGAVKSMTIGWQPTCNCNGFHVIRFEDVEVVRRIDDSEETGKGRDHSKSRNRNGMAGSTLDSSGETEIVIERRRVKKYKPHIPLEDHPIVPCTVLDPFIGSGTTCEVAIRHRRNSIGIDLSREYLAYNAIPRIEGVLRSIPELAHLAHPGEVTSISF